MREIKFRAWNEDKKLGYKVNGYQMRKAEYHPNANKRGYVQEHRLIMENKIGRYLFPRKELVHHINSDRLDNRIENLALMNPKDHAIGHIGERNKNGTFVCKSKEFNELKFRLYDSDRNLVRVFTLNELISKTYRRGNFEYRGRFTGLKDKNGIEIYEGDVLTVGENLVCEIIYIDENSEDYGDEIHIAFHAKVYRHNKVIPIDSYFKNNCFLIGNIYENPELLNK